MSHKRIILERRARFVAAALAPFAVLDGLGAACTPRAQVSTQEERAPVAAPPPPCLSVLPPRARENVLPKARVLYPSNVATPPPTARPVLDVVADFLRANPDVLTVEIIGHADPTEAQGVAYARANLVRSSLVARGIVDGRLRVMTMDATSPLDPNDDAKNRCVEFKVIPGELDK